MTLFAAYKLLVIASVGCCPLALALGAIIDKYHPTESFKNMAIFAMSFVGCISWFVVYLVAITLGAELYLE